MALNPQYLEIGQQFAKQYYTLFDDPNCRAQLVNLYSVSIFLELNNYFWLCEVYVLAGLGWD